MALLKPPEVTISLLPCTKELPAYSLTGMIVSEDLDTDHKWFIARTGHQQEKGFISKLHAQGIVYFLPVTYRLVTHARKRTLTTKALFPGYVFFYGAASSIFEARHTRKCKQIFPAKMVNQSILVKELEAVRKAMLEDPCLMLAPKSYTPGQQVRIIAGGMIGQIAEVSKDFPGYVLLPVTVLGQSTLVKMNKANIRPINKANINKANIRPIAQGK